MTTTSIQSLLLLFVTLSSFGCSTVYNKRWEAAAEKPINQESLEGTWIGRWHSEPSGHQGDLRCIISKSETDDGLYDLSFWAQWKIFSARFQVAVLTSQNQGIHQFEGSKNLGRLAGGLYTFKGQSDGTNFNASYDSRFDQGTFNLQRSQHVHE